MQFWQWTKFTVNKRNKRAEKHLLLIYSESILQLREVLLYSNHTTIQVVRSDGMDATRVILTDCQIKQLISIKDSISIISKLIFNKKLNSPARSIVKLDHDNFTFTCGEDLDNLVRGFRFYISNNDKSNVEQLTTVYRKDGLLKGIVLGKYLGILRTGAIGGIAIDKMAKKRVKSLAIIGSGPQAQMQLRAALSVRDFEECRVFSKTKSNKDAFVANMSRKYYDVVFSAAESIEEAVYKADVIICATNSHKPILFDTWIKEDVHINSIGYNVINKHELDLGLFTNAELIVTDSINQVNGYNPSFYLKDTSYLEDLVELSSLEKPVDNKSKTIFISTGLSGTEVALANLAIDKAMGAK